jgi:hypothetical protein
MSSISQIYASIKDVIQPVGEIIGLLIDRKSTRLNSSHTSVIV